MRRFLLSLIVAWFCALFLVFAQVQLGHIHGVVRDASGTPLAGATVTLTNAAGFRRVAASDARGEFQFRDLPPGQYTVETVLTRFAPTRVSAVVRSAVTAELFVSMSAAGRERVDELKSRQEAARPTMAPPPATQAGVVGGAAGYAQFRAARDFNTEAYDKIDDNNWTAVSNKPLSTFSTDVDTASYANIRRFLNGGSLPPKDAVRIEEMINYFSYEYATPTGDAPVSITTTIGECPWNAHHHLALIGLQARRIDRSQTPPRNLVFLIDVSGSMMMPSKLPLVKSSLAMLAGNLTDNDRVALVVYAGAAGVVLPSTRGGDPTAILDALARLEAGGSTNGAQGIELAYQVAQQHFIKGGVNRVVLATDGDFNVGVTNQGDLIRMIEKNRDSGVTLSVLGYGMGNVKDSTMEKLADRGNGNYSYIDSLSEAQKVLVDEAGGTLVMMAKDVKLQIEFNPRVVSAYRLIGYENRLLNDRDFNDDKKDAGDMGAGHSVTALYELLPAGEKVDLPGVDPLKYQQPGTLTRAAATAEAMTVKIRYKMPDGDTSALMSSVVTAGPRMTPALGFASAVAEFGMLLRDSEFKGSSTFADVVSRAQTYRGEDPFGHRAEFVRLVNMAENLSRTVSRRD